MTEPQRVFLHRQWWKVWTDQCWVAIALGGPLSGHVVAGPLDRVLLGYICEMQGWVIVGGD